MKDPNNGLKQVITEFLNAVMLFEAYLQSGALPYERSPQRKAHRNGTRSRTLKTRVGELTLDKPQFREFPFESSVLKDRGLEGVELVISDAHKGIQKAVESSFVGASWQISLTEVSESFDKVETLPFSSF